MKTFGLSMLFLLAAATFASAQQCDCTITPFKPAPPCFDTCSAKLLSHATRTELEVAYGLKKETVEKIFTWQKNNKERTMTVEELTQANVLSKVERDVLMNRIDSFSEQQLEYLEKPISQRRNAKPAEIRRIF